MAKYMLLINIDPALAPAEGQMDRWTAISGELAGAGHMEAGSGLQGPDTATTVRVRDDERIVTDGPFAETREMLGGYYVIDVPDLDVALDWAARMPNVGYGSVEVRPLMGME